MADAKKLLLQHRPAAKIKKDFYHKGQMYEDSVYDEIMSKGLVVAVDYYGNKKLGVSPYSVQVKLPSSFDTQHQDRWYSSLLPIHNLALPQVGEEVLIIFVTAGDKSQGFWISRFNYTEKFSTNSFKHIDISAIDTDKNTSKTLQDQLFGVNTTKDDIKETLDVEPEIVYDIPYLRVKPGDVVTHGRSNTHIINTFDTKNKKGVIDILTEIEESKKKFYEQEYHVNSKGARVLLTTLSNVDELSISGDSKRVFHKDFGEHKEDSYALIKANQIRLIADTGGLVNHMILAEQYKDWLEKLVNTLKTDIDAVKTEIEQLKTSFDTFITGNLSTHIHASAVGPTSPPTILMSIPEVDTNFNDINSKLDNVKTDLDERLNALRKETFSKNVASN